jgi:predicted nucleotidyltransferase
VTSSREQLVQVAKRLGPLRERAVFVGGATLELLVSDPGATPIRPTDDVDLVVSARSRLEYLQDLSDELRSAGFRNDLREDAPICRWIIDGITVDVMPTQLEILGFANRWYEAGVQHAQRVEVEPGLVVRLLTGPYFIATKLEAFKDRGRQDFLASADIEDVVTVVDGRRELLDEAMAAGEALRKYLAQEFRLLLAHADFVEALAAHLPGDRASQARLPALRSKLERLASAAARDAQEANGLAHGSAKEPGER